MHALLSRNPLAGDIYICASLGFMTMLPWMGCAWRASARDDDAVTK